MRIRLTFSKTAAMRYTGHLDLQRTLERTIRRARLPLAYSQGFNPRPRLHLAAALPLGFTSGGEIAEIWLAEGLGLDDIREQLQAASPPGIELLDLAAVEPGAPKLPNLVAAAEYEITLLHPVTDLGQRLEQVLSATHLERRRRGKAYDLRPLILELQILPGKEPDRPRLRMRLAALPGATGRPEEVLSVLGLKAGDAQIHRTHLILKDG
jgi:radical SAM-linked protein